MKIDFLLNLMFLNRPTFEAVAYYASALFSYIDCTVCVENKFNFISLQMAKSCRAYTISVNREFVGCKIAVYSPKLLLNVASLDKTFHEKYYTSRQKLASITLIKRTSKK